MTSLSTLPTSIECENYACAEKCKFYCNSCYTPLCEKCKDVHLSSTVTSCHEVVHYQQRLRSLLMEKCKFHPTRIADICCEECEVTVCSKCTTIPQHKGHAFVDLETICTERFHFYQKKSSEILEYYIPGAHDVEKEIEMNMHILNPLVDDIRISMYEEFQEFMQMADTILSDNLKMLDQMASEHRAEMEDHYITIGDYITQLEELLSKYNDDTDVESTDALILFQKHKKDFDIPSIPENRKMNNFPRFKAGSFTRKDIADILGKAFFPKSRKEKREKRQTTLTKRKEKKAK